MLFSAKLAQIFQENSIDYSHIDNYMDESYEATIKGLLNLSNEQVKIMCSNAIYDLGHIKSPELAHIRRTTRLLSLFILKKIDGPVFELADIVYLFLEGTKKLDSDHQKNTAIKLQELILNDLKPAKVRGFQTDSERLFIASQLLFGNTIKVVSQSMTTDAGTITVQGNNQNAFTFVFNGDNLLSVDFRPSNIFFEKLLMILDKIVKTEFASIDHAEAINIAKVIEELVKSGVLSDLLTIGELKSLSEKIPQKKEKMEEIIAWARNFESSPITTSIEAILRIIGKL